MAYIYRTFSRISILVLVVVLIISGFAPVSAKGPVEEGSATIDPHTIVTSDGKPVNATTEGILYDKDGPYVASIEGTGEQARGTDAEADDMDIDINYEYESPDTVIGADNRIRIYGTTSYPYSAIVHITYTLHGQTYGCSGWMIGPNTVATAGHCVSGQGQWASNVQVYPGRNGSSTPYGGCYATRLFTISAWFYNSNWNYDYGAIKLNCTIGYNTGTFGIRVAPENQLIGQQTLTAGYPGEKPYGTMWYTSGSVASYSTHRMWYQMDTTGGQSGSAIYNGGANCWPCGIGIVTHSGGYGASYNSGIRITTEVFNNLVAWRNS